MQLSLKLDIPTLERPLKYTDSILLTGSCFTEHMSERLMRHKFSVLQNPNGILFNPYSVAQSLDGYIENKQYTEKDLFYLNELWNSWDHHTRFSDTDKDTALAAINKSQTEAHKYIHKADWVMITLGSAYCYFLTENDKHVANNHRAPAKWFEKKLLSVAEIVTALGNTITKLKAANPNANLLFTISPVRHIREGVVNNNRSKARLIDAVHELCEQYSNAFYFPSYELVIDILRDHRYYDIDFVHPNYMATTYVWEEFVKACVHPESAKVMRPINDLMIARGHRTRFPDTDAHRKFMDSYLDKAEKLATAYPHLDFSEEISYFAG